MRTLRYTLFHGCRVEPDMKDAPFLTILFQDPDSEPEVMEIQ
jgi:hypothetical protein